MTNKINWQTIAATNDADSPAAALALADRLAVVWKESSQVAVDHHYNRKTHQDCLDQKFLRN